MQVKLEDFGNLQSADRHANQGTGSSTRGVMFGGGSNGNIENTIDYIQFSTKGNAADFGNLTLSKRSGAGAGNQTRGLAMGGSTDASPYYTDNIDYVTIATLGNATDFGDLSDGTDSGAGGVNSTTRALVGGGLI